VEVLGNRAIVFFCNTPVRELDLTTRTSHAIPVNLTGGDFAPHTS